MTRDQSTGLMAILLGAVIAYMTSKLPSSMMLGDVGPAVFPYIAAVLLIVCGIGLIVKGRNDHAPSIFNKTALKRLAVIFGVVLLYCVAMNYLGFVIPTAVVLFVLSTMFSEGKKHSWIARIIFAVVLTAAIYLLFRNVLNLKLPTNQLF